MWYSYKSTLDLLNFSYQKKKDEEYSHHTRKDEKGSDKDRIDTTKRNFFDKLQAYQKSQEIASHKRCLVFINL